MHHLFFFILVGGSFVLSAPTPTPTNGTTISNDGDDSQISWEGILILVGLLVFVVVIVLLAFGVRINFRGAVHVPFAAAPTFVFICLRACKDYYPFKIVLGTFPRFHRALTDWLRPNGNTAEAGPVHHSGNDTEDRFERRPVRASTLPHRSVSSVPPAHRTSSLPPLEPIVERDIADEGAYGYGLGGLTVRVTLLEASSSSSSSHALQRAIIETATGPPVAAAVQIVGSSTGIRSHVNMSIRRPTADSVDGAQPLHGAALPITLADSS